MSESEDKKAGNYTLLYRLKNGELCWFNEEKGLVDSVEEATKYPSREALENAVQRLMELPPFQRVSKLSVGFKKDGSICTAENRAKSQKS